MKFLIKTAIIFSVIILLGYVFIFRREFVKEVGGKVEKWVVGILKEKPEEKVRARDKVPEKKVHGYEDVSEKERKELEKIIEQRGR